MGGIQELDSVTIASDRLMVFLKTLVQLTGECAFHKLASRLQSLRAVCNKGAFPQVFCHTKHLVPVSFVNRNEK